MTKKIRFEITSAGLHILAMVLMLCDHLWGTIVPGNDWLTCVGRLAYPIFAFMIVEGYFHTKNLKKYVLRLLIFALISEIPFNLAVGGAFFNPVHQNVLWTFLIAIGVIWLNERAKKKGRRWWLRILIALGTSGAGALIGLLTMVDYYHVGVLTVLVFYFFRGRKWWCYLCQLACLVYLNFEMLGGFGYEFNIFGREVFVARQGLAVLALIPIWLYRGKQGYYNKVMKYIYYGFYPAHLLVLWLIALVIS